MCVYVCVRTCYMLYMRLNYFVGKQHDGRKIPPKFALNPCWDVLERILRKTKWLASWHFGHFGGFLNVFVVYFFSISFGFLGIQKMLLLCKIRILVFLLILGLTILLGNTKQQQQKYCFSLPFHWLRLFFSSCFMGYFGHGSGHIIFSETCMAMCRSRRWHAYWMSGTLQLDWWILWCALTLRFILIWSAPTCMLCRACVKTLIADYSYYFVHLQREVWIYLRRIMLLILFEFCILGEVCTVLSSTVGCSWCLSCTFKQLLVFFALHIYFRGQIKIQWDLKFCQ